MPQVARRVLVWVAVYGIALQAILAPLALAAPATVDPFTVICHSEAATDANPASQPTAPVQTCDHCVLCNVTAGAAGTQTPHLAAVLVQAGRIEPALLFNAPPSALTTHHPARGPPAAA